MQLLQLLQLESFLPPRPALLPPLAILVGFLLMIIGMTRSLLRRMIPEPTQAIRHEMYLIAGLFGIGIVGTAIPVFHRLNMWWFFALYLFVLGRVIEGAITIRFLQKVMYFFAERSLPGGLRSKLWRFVLGGLLIAIMTGAILWEIFSNPSEESISEILFIFTWGVFYLALLGVIYELKPVVANLATSPSASLLITTGLVLMIGGTTIYDFLPLISTVQIPSPHLQDPTGAWFAHSIGQIGYVLGAILAVILFIRTRGRPV